MSAPFKIEQETRDRIASEWPQFRERCNRILESRDSGMAICERNMEEMFRSLAEGPLGYQVENIGNQQDHADFSLVDRGLKLAIVETKGYGMLREGQQKFLAPVLKQAARYAHRHRTPFLMAFDGQILALGRWEKSTRLIVCNLIVSMDCSASPSELFFFTHYGLFHSVDAVRFTEPFDPGTDEDLFKNHHGTALGFQCFAFVGDLRNKQSWKLPYRNPDGTVDRRRLGHAVNYLLSPGGFRGKKAEKDSIPVAATTLVALRLAQAYKEIGQWNPPDQPDQVFAPGGKPLSQELLWTYLYQQGIEELPSNDGPTSFDSSVNRLSCPP